MSPDVTLPPLPSFATARLPGLSQTMHSGELRRTIHHMMFEISATARFCASHQLRLYDGSLEPLHGHDWQVKVTVAADTLDPIGVVMDFHQLQRRVHQIIDTFHNHHLNDLPSFVQVNPSAENVGLQIGQALKLPERVTLLAVEIWETPENCAVVRFVDSRSLGKYH